MVNFTYDQRGRVYMHRRSLDRHVTRNHTDHPIFVCNQCEKLFARSGNLEKHKRTCTGDAVAAVAVPVAAPAAKKRRIASEFKLRTTRKSLGGDVEQFTVNMKGAGHLSTLKKAIAVFTPVMTKFQQQHRAYKFQIAFCVVFHKAVDPAVAIQRSVTLASEMVVVYADASPPLGDVYCQLLNIIEVYEHNGSGWVFSNFASLQLTLWHLDLLRASTFVPLPQWIREKKAVVNVTGTGDDCLKWAVLAGMHPIGKLARAPVKLNRMSTYEEHVSKYDFSFLSFPVPLSSIGSFAKANNLSINVYVVENDEKVIYPLRVSQTVVSDRHVDLLLYECNGIQHYTTIRNFQLVSSQLSNHKCAIYFCRGLMSCKENQVL